MSNFFRFPQTPHFVWLGEGMPRDDKVLSATEVKSLLADEVVIEEKLDGANLGFSLDTSGAVRAQNRGQYLEAPYVGQFARLPAWLAQHESGLHSVLRPELMLFGEWCAARHSLAYERLPDWFLLFDVFDRDAGQFWSVPRRNTLAAEAGVLTVPTIQRGMTTVKGLIDAVHSRPSRYRDGALEGVVIRRESAMWCENRAKLVRPDFTQAIDSHWRKRAIEWNRVDYASCGKTA